MINNRFNVVYHLLGLVKLLFYKLKNKNMESLEMLLVGLFPQNIIKVDVENDGKIVINVDDKKIKFKLPETDLFHKVIYPDVDFSMEYTQLIVDEIKNQLNSKQ
jgi:hypothetical protein